MPSSLTALLALWMTAIAAADTPEPGSAEAIARFTTDPRFLNAWIASVPESPTVPSPSDFLGHVAGAMGELTRSARIHAYFRALAAASPRVHVETIGRSEEGREVLLAAIADEEGIRDLAGLKAATAALADPRRTDPKHAEALIAGARPFYYLNGALHADETGSAEMLMELAYRLAVSDDPRIRRIRENVVVLINPVAEPDGRDKMADWFYRYLKGRTDYAALPRQSPPYWSRYAFVDVNRDAHQLAFEATRAVHRMFFDYHPQVIHDLHEGIPLLQTWNGTGPYNPNLDPIVLSAFLKMSLHEVTTLTALGMPGVWTWDFGDGFGHHYLDSIAMNHNAIGRGYETFGNATAETVDREVGEEATSREWYRPAPAGSRFRWSMRDNVNYQQTAALAILDDVAGEPKEYLRRFHRTGWNSWRKGVEGKPFAFVIPSGQPDRRRVAQLVNLLRAQRIEVGVAREALEVTEGRFAAGSYVVRLDQPYRNYAVDLLTPQAFPSDAPHLPYDDVSWSLPLHFGVQVVPVDDERVRATMVDSLSADVTVEGRVTGDGPVFLLADHGQESLLAARHRLSAFRIEIAEETFIAAGIAHAAGSWILPAQDGLAAAVRVVASELGLDFASAPSMPVVRGHDAPLARIGLFVPWADTDSIGWIRYVLDGAGVPYVYLRDEDLRAGGLRQKVDVIVYGHVRLDLAAQIHGIAPVAGPMPFEASADHQSLGQPVASADITGGPGFAGLRNLEEFVRAGGVLVTLGNASTLALEGGLVRHVRKAEVDLRTPGAHVRARFPRPGHPIAYGYPADNVVFRSNYTVYDTPRRWAEMAYCTSCLDGPDDPRRVVLEWGGAGPIVVSGGGKNAEALAGHPAIVEDAAGKGRVVAFNFNPLHRNLNRGDHRMLWNVLLNWQALTAR
jgi:zinc carboxypeptidase